MCISCEFYHTLHSDNFVLISFILHKYNKTVKTIVTQTTQTQIKTMQYHNDV